LTVLFDLAFAHFVERLNCYGELQVPQNPFSRIEACPETNLHAGSVETVPGEGPIRVQGFQRIPYSLLAGEGSGRELHTAEGPPVDPGKNHFAGKSGPHRIHLPKYRLRDLAIRFVKKPDACFFCEYGRGQSLSLGNPVFSLSLILNHGCEGGNLSPEKCIHK